MEYFFAGTPAGTEADLVNSHPDSVIRFFHKLREKIAIWEQRLIAILRENRAQ